MNDATIYNEDCITGMAQRLAPESVDHCVSSIPFGALFMYSGKKEDIGNNTDGTDMRAGQFGLHLRFFVAQLYRVMKMGCTVCIHIQQLLRYKNQHGYAGRRDFRGACIDIFTAAQHQNPADTVPSPHLLTQEQVQVYRAMKPTLPGFEYVGEFVIPKNPQLIAQRLSLHSLQFKTGRTNARNLAPAVNDYVLIFKKPGDSKVPVPAIYDETRNKSGWLTQEDWIRDACGVWSDIRETDVLEGYRQGSKESEEEKHVCPLQLTVIRRCVRLYTNPGELVLDPFMGIGTTAVVAVQEGRRAVGFELKESYHAKALRYLSEQKDKKAEESKDLFTEVSP